MKRIVSCLLAVALMFSLCFDTYATGLSAVGNNPVEEGNNSEEDLTESSSDEFAALTQEVEINDPDPPYVSDTSSGDDKTLASDTPSGDDKTPAGDTLPEDDKEEKSTTENLGQVDVTILLSNNLGSPERTVYFKVSLTGQEPITLKLNPPGDGEKPTQGDVTFEGLAPGDYTVEVTDARGFAHFSQSFTVAPNSAYALTLMTELAIDFEAAAGKGHPGFLLLGDVNGDGSIDEADLTRLVDDIDSVEQNPKGIAAERYENSDLNWNDEIDLADLECLAKVYNLSGDTGSTLTEKVPASAVTVDKDKDTLLVGDASDLLKSEGKVSLRRENGATISSAYPVSVEFDFSKNNSDGILMEGIVIDSGTEDYISNAVVEIEYSENGENKTISSYFSSGPRPLLMDEEGNVPPSMEESNKVIVIDFGTQIAVKKVTLRIQGTLKNNNLVEIAQVEFLNNMESRIPEPRLDEPENLTAQPGNKSFTLTWSRPAGGGVTGYEVEITSEGVTEIISVKGTTLNVSSFKKGKLVNGTTYQARVRSANGSWRSGYSKWAEVIPKADKKPDAPDGLKLTGDYKAINAAWKKMEDTDSYNLYYREKGTSSFKKVEKIETNKYTLSDLKDETGYEVYVTGVNELGESKPSLTGTVETIAITPAQMPKYRLINPADEREVSEHIINAYFVNGSMRDSERDPVGTKTAWGTVDNNPVSHFYLGSWDSGGYNPLKNNGLFYEFDQAYKLQDFAFQALSVQDTGYFYVKVKYWDENGKAVEISNCSINRKTDSKNRSYYMIHLPEAVTAKKIQFGLARYSASGTITCSEVYFYHYDSLEEDIMALYTDDLHTELRNDVNQSTIDALRKRINTPDEVSGEYHPDRERLERELKTAEDILNAKLSGTVQVHSGITTSDVGRGFSGLNAWQPLGVTAAAGEEITVYVGHNTKKTGDSTNLQLVATQYHSESGKIFDNLGTLKIGRNDITIPKLSTVAAEAGGALYVQYTGKNQADRYAVRVSGGVQVPVLDLYQVTDREERLKRAQEYVTELQTYVGQMETQHNEVHKNSKLNSVKYNYDKYNCILGASDILADTMLFSLPASQILSASGGNAEKIITSVEAMEKMMDLFYQHKGLSRNAPESKDNYPLGHLNIRYQRMFAGAFMYAAGNHIGIEWGSTGAMVTGAPVVADADGRHISGRYFGWGIAHEIGHNINQGTYAIAEITNNYFSVLAQAQDTNNSVRFQYPQVYKKVTSGTKGRASNVFTQLGMYWQLHLAYDSGYNYKTYDDYNEQLQNLFFARVDTYARTPSKAPQAAAGGIALALTGDKDQDLMRLSCAAAEKNILEFFERWGMTPSNDTRTYANQFEKETRAIYYVNDESRVYRLENAATGSKLAAGNVEAVGNVSMSVNSVIQNQVDFVLSANIPAADVLGYEIIRWTTSGGEPESEVAGFAFNEAGKDTIEFHDVVSVNNRVISYDVVVIDKWLNRSAPKRVGEIKIQHDGSIEKSGWTASTNGLTATSDEAGFNADEKEGTCNPAAPTPINNAIDKDTETIYTGTADANAEVILEFNRSHTITGLKYTPAKGKEQLKDYVISIRDESGVWKEAVKGTFGTGSVEKVLFPDNNVKNNIAGYTTMAVKLEIKNQAGTEIGIAELDVLGPAEDNVEFNYTGSNNDTAGIGILQTEFKYGNKAEDVIPAGSLVFTGKYIGNPAYNVVILYDQDGNMVTGDAGGGNRESMQTIMADVPAEGNLANVSEGFWVYWIDAKYAESTIQSLKDKSIRAELYRVNDPMTNEGQRLVSDSVSVLVNEATLRQPIVLKGNGGSNSQ